MSSSWIQVVFKSYSSRIQLEIYVKFPFAFNSNLARLQEYRFPRNNNDIKFQHFQTFLISNFHHKISRYCFFQQQSCTLHFAPTFPRHRSSDRPEEIVCNVYETLAFNIECIKTPRYVSYWSHKSISFFFFCFFSWISNIFPSSNNFLRTSLNRIIKHFQITCRNIHVRILYKTNVFLRNPLLSRK